MGASGAQSVGCVLHVIILIKRVKKVILHLSEHCEKVRSIEDAISATISPLITDRLQFRTMEIFVFFVVVLAAKT